ncbi:MAG: DegT/DnrJ/EryC1/StrS family aminotransferase [Desulfobacteraceae bacterium]|nr:DegT/DnrJ/EryC1/StrS family aminotransferase [Desulfobacteraceae bacterium]MBC2755225.1 DegT/DnrJ/EryC1/StrS family aminotransferase [Desulfobacteraceae bacterium]
MNKFVIAPFQYSFSEEDIDFILSSFGTILRNHHFLTMGEYGENFERNFCEYNKMSYAVSVSSGTSALEIILRTIGVAGGKVIVPTNTFGATIIPVLCAGAIPVFADCTSDLTICPKDVARKMSDDVKAVITVHIGGLISPHTLELKTLCENKSILLVEDAAHAVGSSLNGEKAGKFGIAAAFSFFSTKLMTCGEGGMIVTDDENIDRNARLLRNHAKSGKNRMSNHGYNWRLTEIQSLMGIRQLKRLDEFIAQRNNIAAIYDSILNDLEGVHIIYPPPETVHNRYKYIILLERCSPHDVEKTLRDRYDIPLGGYVYEEPCHWQPAFKRFEGSDCVLAEKLCTSHICLPIYQDMTEEEARFVANSVREVIQAYNSRL